MEQPALQMDLPTGDQVVVALQGAQVLSWKAADGAERLFLSPRSRWDGHSAIRGGVPVCFPQFNQRGPLPKHGFARNLPWQLAASDIGADHAEMQLLLEDSEATRALWPGHSFTARLTITLAPGALRIALTAHNTGTTAWEFTAALHSYLRVDAIAQAQVDGLGGCARWDTVADARDVQQGPVVFKGEYDSVFAAAPQPLRLLQGDAAVLSIAQSPAWSNTVVWNPGATLCAQLPDMPADGYAHMLCVEAACVEQPVRLPPGQQWSGWQQLRAL